MKDIINILFFPFIITSFLYHTNDFPNEYLISSYFYLPFNEILFLLILILWIIYIDLKKLNNVIVKEKIVRLSLYIFFLFIFGLLWTEDMVNGFKLIKTIIYFLIPLILFTIFNRRYITLMLHTLLILVVLNGIFSIGLNYGLIENNFQINYSLISPFINPMYYGTMVTLGLIFFISNYNKNDKKIFKSINIFCIFILLTTIALICNRSSLIGLLVAISYFSWEKSFFLSIFKRILLIFLVLSSILFYLSFINNNCGIRFLNAQKTLVSEIEGNRQGTSLGCRITYIEKTIELYKTSPLVGVGTGDSLYSMKKFFGDKNYYNIITNPCPLGKHNLLYYFDNHNMYLTLLLLFGPIGLLLFIYFLYGIFLEASFINSWTIKLSIIVVSLASLPITLFYTSSNFIQFFMLFISLIYLNDRKKLIDENN